MAGEDLLEVIIQLIGVFEAADFSDGIENGPEVVFGEVVFGHGDRAG